MSESLGDALRSLLRLDDATRSELTDSLTGAQPVLQPPGQGKESPLSSERSEVDRIDRVDRIRTQDSVAAPDAEAETFEPGDWYKPKAVQAIHPVIPEIRRELDLAGLTRAAIVRVKGYLLLVADVREWFETGRIHVLAHAELVVPTSSDIVGKVLLNQSVNSVKSVNSTSSMPFSEFESASGG